MSGLARKLRSVGLGWVWGGAARASPALSTSALFPSALLLSPARLLSSHFSDLAENEVCLGVAGCPTKDPRLLPSL